MNRLFIVTENDSLSFFSEHHNIRSLSSCGQLQERFNAVNSATTEKELKILARDIQSAAVNHECNTIMLDCDNDILQMFIVLAASQLTIYDIERGWYNAGTTGPFIKCVDLLNNEISPIAMKGDYLNYLKRKLDLLNTIPSQASC